VAEYTALKYRVFLSYSHRDAGWGRWLRAALEGYRIDKDLVGRPTPAGPVPRTLRPIFSGRDGYLVGDPLPEDTLAALRASQFLIVLCSPNAAKSRHVNQQILRFRAMGGADRVIPVIVDGKPGDPVRECFPPALRFKLGPHRQSTDEGWEPAAADTRPEGDGKKLARQKVVARVLGLGLDEIEERAKRTRTREWRARYRTIAAVLALTIACSGGWAWARYELSGSDTLLDRALERATVLATESADVSKQLGVPRRVSVGMLLAAENLFHGLAELGGDTPRLRFRHASMLIKFARNYAMLGNTELQSARAAEADRLMQRLAAEDPANLAWQHDLSVTYDELGDVLQAQGRLAEALAKYSASRVIAERLAADGSYAGQHRDLALSYIKVGNIHAAQGALDDALVSYDLSLVIGERLAAADPRNTRWQYDLLVSHDKIGDVLRLQGELDAALARYRASCAIAERLIAADPGNADWQRGLAAAYVKIGDVLALQEKPDEALASYRVSNAIAERLVDSDGSNAGWQKDLSISHERIGFALEARGDFAAALKEYRASLAIGSRLAGADPRNAGEQWDLGIAHEHIGDVLRSQGKLAGALKEYEAKRAIISRLAAADPDNAGWQYSLGSSHARVGLVLEARGDFVAALKEYEAGLRIGSRFAAADPNNAAWQRELAVGYGKIAMIYHRLAKVGQALVHLRKGRDIMAGLVETSPHPEQWASDLARLDGQIAALEGRAPTRAAARPCDPACAGDSKVSEGPVAPVSSLRYRIGSLPAVITKISN
jgi:tetratricopeptide (TPR) repeat protein